MLESKEHCPFNYFDGLYDNSYSYFLQMPKTPSGEKASYVRIAPAGSKPPKPTEPTVGGFSDVKQSAYYADAVLWAVENGITSGIGGGKFAPAQTCKREQIVTFLYRSKGSPQVSITDQFTDMPKSEEFQRAISWAVENNITMGNGKGQFSPAKGCTRAEAMTFIWRAAGRPEPKTEAAFSDMPSSSDFRKAISWAVENNITQGIGNNKFGPNNPCNRGHIVTFLYNAKDL
ncbi:S-layer homology domain-containing protein [Acutalibacter sp. 1XD8-36]|uniref:S-layer homology domain-containing protein n=1 Tax=Acutalibacter sp. 1XD8-36 TaxID=2320852 RepID=UPI00260F5772|nr:S-layer homology domain-containing protein [Acutalibacter sp. 1XD8-36]